VNAIIDAGKTHAPISPAIYGLFLEHARNLIYTTMWSQMLDDRKFYYPIGEGAPPATQPGEAAPALRPGEAARPRPRPRGGLGFSPPRHWNRVGPADAITMDRKLAYTGDQSPTIALSRTEPRGMSQSLTSLMPGKQYVGRIVLAGDADAVVTASLIWGPGQNEMQSVTIDKRTGAYATYPFSFSTPTGEGDGSSALRNARLEITALGSGVLHVGAVSLMPADNIEGWKPEVTAVLKSMRSGLYRWPGGNFVSAHDWRDAIGEPDKRPPVWDPVWKALQPNDIGTDEFMTLCRLVDVEPYITVDSGFGDARSAQEYVEYANGPVSTPMGALRAANGHPEPYHVKYWNIGNEMWGSYQYGYMPVVQYEAKHNLFAKLMRKADPSIILIASGAMPDTMNGSKESLKLGDKLIPDYLGPADWTGALFEHCLDNMDMISEHFYNYDSHLDLAAGRQVPNDPDEPLSDWMRRPANHIRLKYEEYQEYLARIPALVKKPVPIALDEYAYAGGGASYKVVPAYAWNFNEMFRHSDLFQLATMTFATSTFTARNGIAVLNPTGMLFKFYRDNYGTIPVDVLGNSPQPKPKPPVGGEQPAVNAGSETFPLDVAAAWSGDRKMLTVAVVNPTETVQSLNLQIVNADLAGAVVLRQMAPQSLTATVVAGEEPQVKIDERQLAAVPTAPSFPPFSVSNYTLPVK
jgi:alpha-N-arabinofuranosidase